MKTIDWADYYRRLSSEASAEPGRWHTDKVPYMREIMDAMLDPHTEKIVVLSATQVAKTESLLNVIDSLKLSNFDTLFQKEKPNETSND